MRRHSIKDGPENTIGPKGAALAVREGYHDNWIATCSQIFVGPLQRTAQTARFFCFMEEETTGCTHKAELITIPEFGTDELFKAMATPAFREQTKAGLSNYDALLKVHPPKQVEEWRNFAFRGICHALDYLDDGQTGYGFGHSPMIELAVSRILTPEEAAHGFETFEIFDLKDLEGVIFEQNDDDRIGIIEKIHVELYDFGL